MAEYGVSSFDKRTTSAGYRLPVDSRPKSSTFHENCIPREVRERTTQTQTVATGSKPNQPEQTDKSNVVVQDRIWTQSVLNEKTFAHSW